jgi:hypothetical protein
MIMLRSPRKLPEWTSAVTEAKVKFKGQRKEEKEKKEGKGEGGEEVEEEDDNDAMKVPVVSVSFVGG